MEQVMNIETSDKKKQERHDVMVARPRIPTYSCVDSTWFARGLVIVEICDAVK